MDELPTRLAATMPRADAGRRSCTTTSSSTTASSTRPTPTACSSIFDWDMTTLGEPLVDLGTLLNYWPDPSDPPDASARAATRAARRWACRRGAEITARYAERTGLDVSSAGWYEAFAQWKTAVVVQQLHRRWVRGESTDPRMATIADRLPVLAATASQLLDAL